MTGLVTKSQGGFYDVFCDGAVYPCKPRGLFRKEKTVILVGDQVEFTPAPGDVGVIEALFERKNVFSRPPVSNLDRLFLIAACAAPAFDPLFVDKLSVIALHRGVEPVLVLNKCDLGEADLWRGAYARAGFPVVCTNALTGEGIDELRALLQSGISAFAGFSGVGKSSLLSRLLGEELAVGEISHALSRGRHTTRHVQLFPFAGGFVADTPGFSSLELTDLPDLYARDLPDLFPEFAPFLGLCRFPDCTHRREPGCAVREACEQGEIAPSRLASYQSFFDLLLALPDWKRS